MPQVVLIDAVTKRWRATLTTHDKKPRRPGCVALPDVEPPARDVRHLSAWDGEKWVVDEAAQAAEAAAPAQITLADVVEALTPAVRARAQALSDARKAALVAARKGALRG